MQVVSSTYFHMEGTINAISFVILLLLLCNIFIVYILVVRIVEIGYGGCRNFVNYTSPDNETRKVRGSKLYKFCIYL